MRGKRGRRGIGGLRQTPPTGCKPHLVRPPVSLVRACPSPGRPPFPLGRPLQPPLMQTPPLDRLLP